jgi:hypothetical protein
MTRQTGAAGSKALQDQGIVQLAYRRITVIDWARLCDVAKIDAECPAPGLHHEHLPS